MFREAVLATQHISRQPSIYCTRAETTLGGKLINWQTPTNHCCAERFMESDNQGNHASTMFAALDDQLTVTNRTGIGSAAPDLPSSAQKVQNVISPGADVCIDVELL